MGNELIKLNETEQFIANTGLTMTLKDIADYVGKEHKNVSRDFKKMLADLSDDEINQLKFELVEYSDKKGEMRPTFNMDLKTMLLVMTKYNTSLRLQVINFALEKLEKKKEEEIKQVKAMAEKCRIYDDGSTTINGLIEHYGFTDDYDTIKNALLWKGVIDIVPKVTIKNVHNTTFQGIVWTSHTIKKTNGVPVQGYAFLSEPTKSIVDQYKKAGSPDVNLNLREEFENAMQVYISKHLG